MHLSIDEAADPSRPSAQLPETLGYLADGDIVSISQSRDNVRVLWRCDAPVNSVLVTEQCDNYCLMCSQPPKDRDDSWLLDDIRELIELMPADTGGMIFTGGEPTLFGEGFLDVLRRAGDRLPDAALHVLSNGRRFADPDFADSWAELSNPNLMVGIPIYSSEPSLHDYVVQASGAFEETVAGVLRLAERDERIELRVVLHKQTIGALRDIAEFIARNLPFVDQVALMGLEMTGLARLNRDLLWIDPYDYQAELAEAALLLERFHVPVRIYNHQLCVLDRRVWHLAVKSISDWKADFLPACESCSVMEQCGGVFTTSHGVVSEHLSPVSWDSYRGSRWPSRHFT